MPRRSDQPRSVQLLVRLTPLEFDVLSAAAHLERVTAPGYAYGLLQAHLASLAADPHVQVDLKNRAAYAVRDGGVARLRRTRDAENGNGR